MPDLNSDVITEAEILEIPSLRLGPDKEPGGLFGNGQPAFSSLPQVFAVPLRRSQNQNRQNS